MRNVAYTSRVKLKYTGRKVKAAGLSVDLGHVEDVEIIDEDKLPFFYRGGCTELRR